MYDLYEQVVKECETCSKLMDAPPRSKVSGMRATIFGDLIFIDYGAVKNSAASARTRSSKTASSKATDDEIREPSYDFMIILDGATNFIYAIPLDDLTDASGQRALRDFMHHMQVKPKRIVGDSAFTEPSWELFYTTHDIQPITMGPFTPWPNRAGASVRLLKKHIYQLFEDVRNDPVRKAGVTVQDLIKEGCWVRNVSCTYGGKTPIELAFGRRPPDIIS